LAGIKPALPKTDGTALRPGLPKPAYST
jgi:hypothetical protein